MQAGQAEGRLNKGCVCGEPVHDFKERFEQWPSSSSVDLKMSRMRSKAFDEKLKSENSFVEAHLPLFWSYFGLEYFVPPCAYIADSIEREIVQKRKDDEQDFRGQVGHDAFAYCV